MNFVCNEQKKIHSKFIRSIPHFLALFLRLLVAKLLLFFVVILCEIVELVFQ